MNIHEYQGKAVLKEFGVPVSNGRAIFRADAWFGICPGVLLILIVLALNATADAIGRDFDPRSVARATRQTGI